MAHHPSSLTVQLHAVLTHGVGPTRYLLAGAIFVGLVVGLRYLCTPLEGPFARFWLGKWVYQESTRDWHRVISKDHLGEMVDMTSHDQRRANANKARQERLWGLALISAVIGVTLLQWKLTGRLEGNHPFFGVLLVMFAAICALVLPFVVIPELLYLGGFQRMDGPRVLHPIPPPPLGAEVVSTAYGHGNAGPAPLDKIHDALSGNRAGEPDTIWKE